MDSAFSSVTTPVRVAYYSLAGERVTTPINGIFLMRVTMSDGSTITRKVAR